MLGQVDAHGLGGDLVIPDGDKGPAVGGVDDQHDDADADARHDEGEYHAVKARELPQQVGGVGQGAQLVPLDDGAHDLGKAEGGDGQVVALELQHRQADEPGEEHGHETRQDKAHHHRQAELDPAAFKVLVHGGPGLHGDGEDAVGIGAQHHKARLAQGEQARKAVEQVQGHRHQGIDGALFQHRGQHGVVLVLIHIQQKCKAHGGKDQREDQISCFILLHSLHLLRQFFTEQTVGLAQQDKDQQGKGEGVAENGDGLAGLDEGLADADDKGADHRAGDGADAAEHRRHEGLQARHGADHGAHLAVVGEVQHGGNARQEGADGKGHGDDGVDLDAHELGGLKIPGHGPHGHADLGLLDEDHQDHHQDNGEDGGDDGDTLDAQVAHLHHLGQEGDIGIGAGDTAGDVGGQILQQVAHADGGDHHRHTRGAAQGAVGRLFDDNAQDGGEDQHQGQRHGHGHGGGHVDHEEARHHEDIAVGKVDEPQDTVHHGVADGDQRVETAYRDAGEQQLDIIRCVMHKFSSSLFGSCAFGSRGHISGIPKHKSHESRIVRGADAPLTMRVALRIVSLFELFSFSSDR